MPISKHQYTSGMTTTKASRSTITNSNNNKNNKDQTSTGNLSVMKANLNLPDTGCRFSGEERFYHLKQITITYGSVSAGREKWPFNVLFFLKVEPPCDQT